MTLRNYYSAKRTIRKNYRYNIKNNLEEVDLTNFKKHRDMLNKKENKSIKKQNKLQAKLDKAN